MKRKNDTILSDFKRLLKARGLQAPRIRLCCTNCKGRAMAQSVTVARLFGWTKLKKRSGFAYEGLCIDCPKPKHKRRRS